MKKYISILISTAFLTGCSTGSKSKDDGFTVLPASEVKWEKLNPARGDKSPQAGTLWGDRKGEVETAFLAKFVDGFSSPPHIHNVSYRGIVISGLVHNDDPKAAKMWMPKASYWTQPAGESHITAAKGGENIAYIEIDKGPYLVKPAQKAFDSGERPFNIHASNIIWTKSGDIATAPLWMNAGGKVTGSLIKYQGKLNLKSKSARVVVIGGTVKPASRIDSTLSPGSSMSLGNSGAALSCIDTTGCILYVKSNEDLHFR